MSCVIVIASYKETDERPILVIGPIDDYAAAETKLRDRGWKKVRGFEWAQAGVKAFICYLHNGTEELDSFFATIEINPRV